MKTIKKGDKVKVEYVGTLEDGTVFDSSDKHDTDLEFIVGEGQIIKGFDDAVVGMEIGEEKEVKLPPEQAYGSYNPEFVKEMPRNVFPADQELKPDMIFMVKLEDGRSIPVRVTKIEADKVTIDLNPPLAGKTLIFKIKIKDIAS